MECVSKLIEVACGCLTEFLLSALSASEQLAFAILCKEVARPLCRGLGTLCLLAVFNKLFMFSEHREKLRVLDGLVPQPKTLR